MGAGWDLRGVVSAPYKEWQCKLPMHDYSRCEGGRGRGEKRMGGEGGARW